MDEPDRLLTSFKTTKEPISVQRNYKTCTTKFFEVFKFALKSLSLKAFNDVIKHPVLTNCLDYLKVQESFGGKNSKFLFLF